MKIQEPQAVIWDMDGVIADTASAHYQSWQFAFQKQGADFSDQDFHNVFGQRNDLIIRKMMGAQVSRALIDSISADKEDFFREHIVRDVKAFPGVISLLRLLKTNGIRAAVGSSAPLENIRVILQGLKIQDYFQALVYGLEVNASKPSPDIFQKAAQKLAVQAANCIVIEDAIVGVQAARRASMHCLAVTNTHQAEDLKAADWVVDTLEKVDLESLKKILSST